MEALSAWFLEHWLISSIVAASVLSVLFAVVLQGKRSIRYHFPLVGQLRAAFGAA